MGEKRRAMNSLPTRRDLLGAAIATTVSAGVSTSAADDSPLPALLADAVSRLQYLTPPEQFCKFVREKPRIDQLPPEKLRDVGLHPDTWELEVLADPESDSKLENPLTKARGTAVRFADLMKVAEKHAVRFLKVMTCTNVADPFGVGLWEGVPLREVIWFARPTSNVRRVYCYGYHNDDPKQRFQASLPLGRILEDAPDDLPVILCYKCNGQWLSPKAGGPVRLIVPESYGNRSIKWLKRVVLTNSFQANDTYALWNNDVESPMKTCARFISPPQNAKAGQPLAIVGGAQVGMSGLSKVQVAVRPQRQETAASDPFFAGLDWRDARILPPPTKWGGGLTDGKLPAVPLQFDAVSGQPRSWPLRYALAHWAILLDGLPAGQYILSCRSIDGNGIAQPMPRPLPKSGVNSIQHVKLSVESA